MNNSIYQNFLGTWLLDVASCQFEQGEPPQSASNTISIDGRELVIAMDWIDDEGEAHHMSFRAIPDGSKMPFDGGPLADALSVTATSGTEIVTSAFRDGIELMTATRTLSGDGTTMQIEQTVNLPDGTKPTNISLYFRGQ